MNRRLFCQSLFLPVVGSSTVIAAQPIDLSRVHGRVQWVTSFPDYKIKIVDSFADLHVQWVTAFPDRPGKWQIVESFPHLKIQIVESFPDFTVKYVESFPGVQN